ncbi:hypothetical protein EZJ55_21960 [Microcystis aeruginosa EAWAG127a]|uniref:Uncharacterized protein n=1 Tax=Microcystis aeruginosa EAWAG127a TaxID=2529855 RepID=A0A5J5LZG8_MICAE|nr:hypothetical protein EZJ55_21960 [Microcystis aeruginosa EAWAG127a]
MTDFCFVTITDIIAFPIHKRYILDLEKFSQQRFKCVVQVREPLYTKSFEDRLVMRRGKRLRP